MMNFNSTCKKIFIISLCLFTCSGMSQTRMTSNLEQERFYLIFKELVNIDTTNSAGDNTKAVIAI